MAETTTLIMARMVRRPSAPMATLVIIRMRARLMATGGLATSWMASSSESAPVSRTFTQFDTHVRHQQILRRHFLIFSYFYL